MTKRTMTAGNAARLALLSAVLAVSFSSSMLRCNADAVSRASYQLPGEGLQGRTLLSDESGAMRVYNSADFFKALIDPNVETVLLSTPVLLLDEDYAYSFLARHNITPPVTLTRNVSLLGDPQLAEVPIVYLSYIKSLIKLAHGVTFTIANLRAAGAVKDSMTRSSNLDILAPTDKGSVSNLRVRNTDLVAAVCYSGTSPTADLASLAFLRRDDGSARFSMTFALPQDGCVNDTSYTSRPWRQRCWSRVALNSELYVYGAVDEHGIYAPTNIIVGFDNLTVFCSTDTGDCEAEGGAPYECYIRMLPDAISRERRQMLADVAAVLGPAAVEDLSPVGMSELSSPPAASSSQQLSPDSGGGRGGGGSGKNVALVAGVVGGIAGVAAVALVLGLVLLLRRRRRRTSASGGEKSTVRSADAAKVSPTSAGSPTSSRTDSPHRGDFRGQGLPQILPLNDEPITMQVPQRADLDLDTQLEDEEEDDYVLPQCGMAPRVPTDNNEQQLLGTADSSSCAPGSTLRGISSSTLDGGRVTTASGRSCNVIKLLPVVKGKGGFGRVYEGEYSGQRVAVKVIQESYCSNLTDVMLTSLQQEIEVLGRCQHPNIVRLLAACVQPPRLCLVLELMETSLERLLYGGRYTVSNPVPLTKVLYIGHAICQALAYLHPTIVHRDLKPSNVLINDPWGDKPTVKLTDFGLSRLRETTLPTRSPDAGTPAYMAPECFDVTNNLVSHRADIYALGILLWEMLAGTQPWAGLPDVAIGLKVSYHKERPPMFAIHVGRLSRKMSRVLDQCWDHDPARRPAADEVGKQLALELHQQQHQQHLASGDSAFQSVAEGD